MGTVFVTLCIILIFILIILGILTMCNKDRSKAFFVSAIIGIVVGTFAIISGTIMAIEMFIG